MSSASPALGPEAVLPGARVAFGLHAARAALLLATLLCALSYVFVASVGKWRELASFTDYYDQLAQGFRAGQLHLLTLPPPELLAQADPFSQRNVAMWLFDATLHNGKYYIYWGPVPALVLAAVKDLFDVQGPIGDEWPTLLLSLGQLCGLAWLLWLLVRNRIVALPLWAAPALLVVLALGGPMPFTLSRGAVYEAAIVGGQCFVWLGAACALAALLSTQRRSYLFAAAGLCWGLAIGCRASLAPAVGVVCLVTSLYICKEHKSLLRGARASLALVLPLAALLALHGWYNYARFGSVTDFGIGKQLSSLPFQFSFANYVPNLYSYLLRAPDLDCGFPFVSLSYRAYAETAEAFPKGFSLPVPYTASEPTIGLVRCAPFCLLALAGLVVGFVPRLRRSLAGGDETRQRLLLWAVTCFLAFGTFPLVASLGMWMATTRFEVDVSAGIMLLAVVGAAGALKLVRGPGRAAIGLAIAALATYSVVVGLLLAFSGYTNSFTRFNPELYHSLQQYSVCSTAQD